MLWFLLPSQSQERKESGVVMEEFIWLLGFCILGFHSGKTIFCHFSISLWCLKSQLQSSIVHEERSQLLWMP